MILYKYTALTGKLALANGQPTTIPVVVGDDGTIRIDFDFAKTGFETSTKYLNLVMADGTYDLVELGTGTVVSFTLGSEHTKNVGAMEYTLINPYVILADNSVKSFPTAQLKIEKTLTGSIVTATIQEFITNYIDAKVAIQDEVISEAISAQDLVISGAIALLDASLAIKSVTAQTLSPGTPATASMLREVDGLTFAFGIPAGAKIISCGFDEADMVFTLDDGSTVSIVNAYVTLKGDKGDKGDTGDVSAAQLAAGLATKSDKLTATNLLTNGDFSSGTTGWTGFAATIAAASNVLAVTGSGTSTVAEAYSDFTLQQNSKLCVHVFGRVTNSDCTMLKTYGGNGKPFVEGQVSLIANPIKDRWYDLGAVVTTNATGSSRFVLSAQYASNALANGKVAEYKYVVLSNLTTTFGAGKECSAIEYARVLSYFTNSYFSGSSEIVNGKYFFEKLNNVMDNTLEFDLFNTLALPPKMYSIANKEVNVYYDSLVKRKYQDDMFQVNANIGIAQDERWTNNSSLLTDYNITFNRYSKTRDLLATGVTQLKMVAASAKSGQNPKCLFIGDSLTEANTMTGELLTLMGADVMDVTLIGTKGTSPNLHEGIGGWTVAKFYTDATSPFVFSGAFNFSQYMSTNGFAGVDYVFIGLGINDVFALTTDDDVDFLWLTMKAQLEAMIANIKVYNASVKVGILTPIPPSNHQDSFGKSYWAGKAQWVYKECWHKLVCNMIDYFKNREAESIYIVPTHLNIDTERNMQTESVAANSRNSTTIVRQSNGVHPAASGYYQMADSVYYFLKNV